MRFLLLLLFAGIASAAFAQYQVTVQVVDLQVSVTDSRGNFVSDLKPEDFVVKEDGVQQQVLDLEQTREPFSIAILLDTSDSMRPDFETTTRATQDFLGALAPDDEYFVMTFDDKLLIKKDFALAGPRPALKLDLHYGDMTRLYDALLSAIDRLKQARYPRRALFLISDGLNTAGKGDLRLVIQLAQEKQILFFSFVVGGYESDLNALQLLTEETGGTYFDLYSDTPRLFTAYQRIAQDLAHRFTLFYRSTSDYTGTRKPVIKLETKDPHLRVKYQKSYYPAPAQSPEFPK